MKRLLKVLLLCFAVSLPIFPRTNQDSGQQQSSSNKAKRGKKEPSGGSQSGTSSASNGATAKCKDGTYSFSKHHQGTCSHHGGVAKWYK